MEQTGSEFRDGNQTTGEFGGERGTYAEFAGEFLSSNGRRPLGSEGVRCDGKVEGRGTGQNWGGSGVTSCNDQQLVQRCARCR